MFQLAPIYKRPRASALAMGASASSGAVDPNPIRIRAEQSLRLLGIMHAKSTLVWADVVTDPHVTFKACFDVGIPAIDLHRMQPCLREWTQLGRCSLLDCDHMVCFCLLVYDMGPTKLFISRPRGPQTPSPTSRPPLATSRCTARASPPRAWPDAG